MKKLLLGLMVLATMSLGVVPAQAQHHGKVCKNIYGAQYPFPQLGTVCVTTNTRDIQLGSVEALSFVQEEQFTSTEVQWDWVHLYKNGSVVQTNGGTSWENAITHAGEQAKTSTDWHHFTQSGDDFRSVARVRMRNNNNTSDWYKFDSDVWTCGTYCNLG